MANHKQHAGRFPNGAAKLSFNVDRRTAAIIQAHADYGGDPDATPGGRMDFLLRHTIIEALQARGVDMNINRGAA